MIVGTAGHIDHGKTSLVRALTGVDTDRLKEEKARGISIDLGFAYLPMPDGDALGFIDVPGHEAFVHNMLAGVAGIDVALLVVAADDGVMPQTRGHLAIIDLLQIKHRLIALTKIDKVPADQRDAVITRIRGQLADTSVSDAAIVPVSTVTGEGVGELRGALITMAGNLQRDATGGRFRLAVDRSFTLQGTGTVVTGTVLSGAVTVGDEVTVSPSGLIARVRSIHAQNQSSTRGSVGQRCALNLAGDRITKEAISRGDVILDAALHGPTDRIDAKLQLLAVEPKPVTQWMPVRLHHGSAQVAARIVLLDDKPVAPSETAFVQLVLERPIAVVCGDRYVLRDTTDQRTIGGGQLLDLRAPARKRRTPERKAQLEALALGEPSVVLAALLDQSPWYVDLSAFVRDFAISDAETKRLIQQIGVLSIAGAKSTIGLAPAVWLRLKTALLAALATFHAENPDLPGIGLERLRMQLTPRLPAPAFADFLRSLARKGELGLDGAWVRLSGHEVKLTPADEKTWTRILPLISGTERFRPPRVRDISGVLAVPETEIRRLLKLLGRMGKVDEIAHDHFFLRSTVSEMTAIATDVAANAPKGEFTAAQLRDRLDNGRKVAIQILDFFDRHGVTLRRGDLRRINRHRVDLFRTVAGGDGASDNSGRDTSPVGRPDFKSGKGRETVLGGFDSLSLPPPSSAARGGR